MDTFILTGLNLLARKSWALDSALYLWVDLNLLKGGVLLAAIVWAWFTREKREKVLATLTGGLLAILVARTLAMLLPFRVRPLHNPDLSFVVPYGLSSTALSDWNSMPSDHATLFFALAVGLLCISRRVGLASLFYVGLFICLPRVYFGMHYPSDILIGGIIGVAIATLVNRPQVCTRLARPWMRWHESHPGIFYALFFLFLYQMANLFDGLRTIASFLASIGAKFLG